MRIGIRKQCRIKAGYFTGKANVIQITPMTGTKQVVTNTDDENNN